MNKNKSIISILVVLAILTACLTNTYAQDNDKMIIELSIGSSTGKVNGKISQVEKPYVKNKAILIPLAWVTTAIGAEVNQKANKKIEIIYRDMNAELTLGSKDYTVGSEAYKLTVAPEIKNGRTMLPVDFIAKNFPVSVNSDIKKGSIKIILEDDGALSDLSFLTGGISSKKLGNSFYGWSVSIPSGSRIAANNYKSSQISIVNEGRSLYLDINVKSKNNMTLSELYDSDVLHDSSVRESKLDLEAKIPYIQYTTLSVYDESSRIKVFDKGEYFYYLIISSDDDFITPEKLMSDKYYDNIVSSFDLSYKGNEKGVEDVSKVKDGKASFYNYISLSYSSKYLTWAMDMPIKWENKNSIIDPTSTTINLDSKHYMQIMTNTLDEGIALQQYVDEVKSRYDEYFNPKIYTYIGKEETIVAGMEAYKLIFNLNYGNNNYYVEELYLEKGGFVYEVSIFLPEKDYEALRTEVINAIDKMTFYTVNKQKYQQDLELYTGKYSGVRVSNQDGLYNYVNRNYNWTADIPGYWVKNNYYDDSELTFSNKNTSASVSISVTDKIADSDKNSVSKEFGMDLLEMVYQIKPVISETNEKGVKIKNYTYRIENQEYNLYGTILFKVFDKDDYTYCFRSEMYDLNATDKAIAEVNSVWESFKLTK